MSHASRTIAAAPVMRMTAAPVAQGHVVASGIPVSYSTVSAVAAQPIQYTQTPSYVPPVQTPSYVPPVQTPSYVPPVAASAMPVMAPPSALASMPDPAAIAKQKEGYAGVLDEQMKQ